MEAARRVVERILRATYPFATYLPQYYLLQKTSKEGFAPATCLAALLARTLSIAAWANGAHPRDASAPAGGALGILVQLLLLDAVVQAKRKKAGRLAQKKRYGATTRQLGREVRAVIRAACRDRDRELATERFRKLWKAFWAWDELGPYVEVVVVFALYLIAASCVLNRFRWWRTLLVTAAAAADAAAPVPQIVRIIRRRDAAGVSAFTILLRLAGGVVGARVGARPRFSVLQAGLDACLCVQLAWYSPPLTRVRGVISAALEPLAALARRGAQRLRAYRRRSYARVPTGEGPPAAPSTRLEEGSASPRRESPAKEAAAAGGE